MLLVTLLFTLRVAFFIVAMYVGGESEAGDTGLKMSALLNAMLPCCA